MISRKKLQHKLVPGLILPIYVRQNSGELKFEFKAELVRLAKSWRELEPYVYKNMKPETQNINAVKESWVVRVVSDSPFDNGREMVRWIPKFYSMGELRVRDLEPEEVLLNDENSIC